MNPNPNSELSPSNSFAPQSLSSSCSLYQEESSEEILGQKRSKGFGVPKRKLRRNQLNPGLKIEEMFRCDSCDSLFTAELMLMRHNKEVHQKVKPHKCFKCGKSFARVEHVKRHLKKYHSGSKTITTLIEYPKAKESQENYIKFRPRRKVVPVEEAVQFQLREPRKPRKKLVKTYSSLPHVYPRHRVKSSPVKRIDDEPLTNGPLRRSKMELRNKKGSQMQGGQREKDKEEQLAFLSEEMSKQQPKTKKREEKRNNSESTKMASREEMNEKAEDVWSTHEVFPNKEKQEPKRKNKPGFEPLKMKESLFSGIQRQQETNPTQEYGFYGHFLNMTIEEVANDPFETTLALEKALGFDTGRLWRSCELALARSLPNMLQNPHSNEQSHPFKNHPGWKREKKNSLGQVNAFSALSGGHREGNAGPGQEKSRMADDNQGMRKSKTVDPNVFLDIEPKNES